MESFAEFGEVLPIVIDPDGEVLDGHQRLSALLTIHGADYEVDVRISDRKLSETEREQLVIRLHTATGGWDWDELANWDSGALVDWGLDKGTATTLKDDAKEILALLNSEIDGAELGEDLEPVPDILDELQEKWNVQPGQLYLLGGSRLICGDSTDPETVQRLFGGVEPQLMVTDPPYGVNYDPTWRAEAGVNKNHAKMGKVSNDDRADWREAWELFPGDVAYVYHAGINSPVVAQSLIAAGFEIRSQIIWAKDRMALSRGDYHWQHEPCWYAVRKGGKGWRTDDRSQTTLWEIPARDDSGHGHGTQKPLECMARPIRNHTLDTVYDPFGGSGTTLIAAEKLGVACFMVELDVRYVALILERFSTEFSGAEMKLLEE